MAYAITLRLDASAGVVVEAMWRALADRGIGHDAIELGYPPHITLAVYPEDAPAAEIRKRITGAATKWSALPVYLSGYGVFPGPPVVVWIVPVISAELLARHASLHSALRTFPCERHYLPGNWMPHITLTSAATSASRAMEVLTPLWRGAMLAHLDRLELVSFHPAQVLWTQALGSL